MEKKKEHFDLECKCPPGWMCQCPKQKNKGCHYPPGGICTCLHTYVHTLYRKAPYFFGVLYMVSYLLKSYIPDDCKNEKYEIAQKLLKSFKPDGKIHGLVKAQCPRDWLTRKMMMFFFNKLLNIKVRFDTTKYQQVESVSPYYIDHVRRLTTFEWQYGEFSPPTTVIQYKKKLKIQLDPQILLDLLKAEICK
jgi:hypothetical protein